MDKEILKVILKDYIVRVNDEGKVVEKPDDYKYFESHSVGELPPQNQSWYNKCHEYSRGHESISLVPMTVFMKEMDSYLSKQYFKSKRPLDWSYRKFYQLSLEYRSLIVQQPSREQFITCDEEGNFLEEPKEDYVFNEHLSLEFQEFQHDDLVNDFNHAKKKVIFWGFKRYVSKKDGEEIYHTKDATGHVMCHGTFHYTTHEQALFNNIKLYLKLD